MKKLISIGLLALALSACGQAQPAQIKPHELTYSEYYDQTIPIVHGHAVMDPCTFVKHTYQDTNYATHQHFTNFYVTCKESGENPTIAQQAFWIQYVLASDCQSGRTLACDADVAD